MKIRPVGAALFHVDRQTYGRTDVQTDVQADGRTDVQADGRTYRRTYMMGLNHFSQFFEGD